MTTPRQNASVEAETDAGVRHLVLHDYGMGGEWWWVRARSGDAIVEAIAEVEVITDPVRVAQAEDEELDEVVLDDLPAGGTLADLRDQRTAQRGDPDYGVLAGRERVYLRDDDEEYEGVVFLSEVGRDGRRLRQVELAPDGAGIREDDFPIDPPVDLRDPQYVAKEVSAEEFERAWAAARPADPA